MKDISNTFLADIQRLAEQCQDAEEAMRRNMIQTRKLLHAQYVNNLFRTLRMKKIGNAETEELSKRICKEIKSRTRTLVNTVIQWKYEDSIKELRKEKYNQTKVWRECKPTLDRNNKTEEYNEIWIREKRRLKQKYKEKMEQKVKHLRQKYGYRRELPDEVEGVIIKDQELPEEFESNPRCYDNVEITDEEKKVLLLPPKFTVYENVDVIKTIAEIEKGMVKLRWEMNEVKKKEEGNVMQQKPVYDPKKNSFDFRKMRATDMPNNKKVMLPKPTNSTEELRIQILKRDLVKTAEEYTKTQNSKWSNLNEEEKNGLESLLEKKKNLEIVTNVTDKSGRFSVDSVENYIALNKTESLTKKNIKNQLEI